MSHAVKVRRPIHELEHQSACVHRGLSGDRFGGWWQLLERRANRVGRHGEDAADKAEAGDDQPASWGLMRTTGHAKGKHRLNHRALEAVEIEAFMKCAQPLTGDMCLDQGTRVKRRVLQRADYLRWGSYIAAGGACYAPERGTEVSAWRQWAVFYGARL